VQFHPESTAEIVAEWVRFDEARLPRDLDQHLDELRLDPRQAAEAARAAVRLFDAFWAGAARRAARAGSA
jgi:hypothetical protein